MATSSPDGEPEDFPEPDGEETDSAFGTDTEGELFFEDIEADLVLHNATQDDLVVRIRELKPGVDAACDVLEADPGGLVDEALFGVATTWTMPPNTNMPVIEHGVGERPCYAAHIEGDGLPPQIALWRDLELQIRTYPGAGRPSGNGVVMVSGDREGYRIHGDFLHTPQPRDPQIETCAPADDGHRVAWSTPVPVGDHRLDAVEPGLDGCLALTLTPKGAEVPGEPWFLCVSADAFPFEAGDLVRAGNIYDAGHEGVEIVDDETGRRLVLSRGRTAPAVAGIEWTFEAQPGCEYGVEATCGTVTRAGVLRASAGERGVGELRGGEVLELRADDGRVLRIEAAVVQERGALDAECAFGSDLVGGDVELTVTELQE